MKLIKLYIESKVQHITTAGYSHKNCTTKIGYATNVAEFKETVKFTYNTVDMGTKYCQKQPMLSKLGCWMLIRK